MHKLKMRLKTGGRKLTQNRQEGQEVNKGPTGKKKELENDRGAANYKHPSTASAAHAYTLSIKRWRWANMH